MMNTGFPMRTFLRSGSAATLLSCTAAAFGQQAAESNSPQVEEIVVTAQKRQEGLQDVPIAIAVVSGEDIQRMSVRNLEEIATTTPGFQIQQSPAQSGIYIRSIGSGASNQGFEQSVGLFIDGVYAGRERLFQAPFLDIQRVEVLKGPQSVILGKNTTAGAINITTARPTDELEGSVSALYGENGEYAGTAILSGPLSESVSGRFAARASGMDGYLRNTFTGEDEPQVDDIAARASLQWEPSDALTMLLKAEYAQSRQTGNTLAVSQLTPTQLAAARTFDPQLSLDPDAQQKSADAAGLPGNEEYNDLTSTTVTATIDYDIADWTLTSISALGRLEYEQGTDADHQPSSSAVISLRVASDYEQLSQELRLASPLGRTFEILGGAYYQASDVDFLDWIPCVQFAAVPGVGLPTAFCAPARWRQEQETLSGFVRATWNVTESLRANAGVRYTHESKEAASGLTITTFDGSAPNTNPFDLLIARVVGGWANHTIPKTERTENSWSPSFSVQYDLTPDVMLYGSYTKGTKGGGFNPLNGTGALSAWEFGPETARSYEGGVKSTLFGRRLALNLAAYSSEFEDLQVSQFNGVTFVVTNAGSAKVDGAELDLRWRATRDLSVGANLAYLDSRYGTFLTGPCRAGQNAASGCVGGFQDLSGEPLPFAPEWAGTLDIDYSHDVGASLRWSTHWEAVYTDSHYLAPDNDRRAFQSGYAKVNARLALGSSLGSWEVALIGKNLTDEITKGFENDIIGHPNAFYAQVLAGRTFAVQGMVRF
jgi:outer membrane receptor protein involved in Fe transport